MDTLRFDAHPFQGLALDFHEGQRTADVVIGVLDDDLILDLVELDTALEVVVRSLLVALCDFLVEDGLADLWVLPDDLGQGVLHGVHAAVANGVDEHDAAGLGVLGDGGEHGHHGGQADAAGDEDNGGGSVEVEDKVTEGHGDVDFRAFGERLVENIGDLARGLVLGSEFSLDRDPEVVSAWRIGQAVLTGLVDAELGDEALDGDELAGLVGRESALIDGG